MNNLESTKESTSTKSDCGKPVVSGSADIFKTIAIPTDINWVRGLQIMDGKEITEIIIDGEVFTAPKKVVYLIDKLLSDSQMWKRQSEMHRNLLLKKQGIE